MPGTVVGTWAKSETRQTALRVLNSREMGW